MTIAGASSAYPSHRYSQAELLGELMKQWGPKVDNPMFMERLQSRVGVDSRHLAIPLDQYAGLRGFGKANDHWIRVALEVAEKALTGALERAGVSKDQLGALFFVSITGISSPSIDAKLINTMKLPVNIKRVPVFGLGCVAGAAGLARAADYVRAFPDQAAALVSVELCSLTIQQDDLSVANLISTGLFGDGGAAVIVAGADVPAKGPKVLATRSVFYPESEGVMGWEVTDTGFRIVLTREVPEVVQRHLAGDVDSFLSSQGLSRADIGAWVVHTGGPRVLESTQAALGLPNGALDVSWECLRRTGNLSSASVLVVLEEFLMKKKPEPGTYGVLAAMGPGFCSELVLLRW
ncbi:MAG: 3-oxoacyl-[acyl-carrier-protein] synthase III C-terminal domain-containing protein [Bryobacteraceae bacterium]